MLSNENKRRRSEARAEGMRERRSRKGRRQSEQRRREEKAFQRMAEYLEQSARRLKRERYVSAFAGIRSSHVAVEQALKYQIGQGHTRIKTAEANRTTFLPRLKEAA